jgi:adenylate cyclase
LYGALPASVADRLIAGEDVSGDHADEVSVLFLDIVGFTMIAERISAKHLLDLLRAVFKVCDDACRDFGLTKIKTIGDAFLAVAGVPEFRMDHAQCTANAAIKIMKDLDTLEITSLTSTGSASDTSSPDNSWIKEVGTIKVRIGLHSGPVVAGIVGEERLQYDIWGDTVNIASRMESTGEPGKIQVSESFTDALNLVPRTSIENLEPGTWNLELRGETAIKGKGTMRTYWLEGA